MDDLLQVQPQKQNALEAPEQQQQPAWMTAYPWQCNFGYFNNSQKTQGNAVEKDEEPKNEQPVQTAPGINAPPAFYKQYDHPKSPYVAKAEYEAMKAAMDGTPYSEWNIDDKRIKKIYQRAVRKNGGDPSTIKSSGCGATSFGNLKNMNPTAAAEFAMQNGGRTYGCTTKEFFASNGGERIPDGGKGAIKGLEEVAKGRYLICSMGKGHWCGGSGHYILVYGFDGRTVYVSDPNSDSPKRATGTKYQFTSTYKYGFLFNK